MFSVFKVSAIALGIALSSSVVAQELLPVIGNGNMYRYMAPISQSSVDNMIAESGGLVDNRPEPVLGELLVLESSTFSGASDYNIRALFTDGDVNTQYRVNRDQVVDFRITEPSTVMISSDTAQFGIYTKDGREIRRDDGSLLLKAGQTFYYGANISGPSNANIEFRDLPAGEYSMKLISDIRFHDISIRIPDHLLAQPSGIVLDNFTDMTTYGASFFDGRIDNRYDISLQNTVDITLQTSGRLSISNSTFGGQSGTNIFHGVSITPINGGNLTSPEGIKWSQGGYPLMVYYGKTQESTAVFPAGQYRISTVNSIDYRNFFSMIAEIEFIPEPLPVIDTGVMEITDWLVDSGNEATGYLPDWFDGITEETQSRRSYVPLSSAILTQDTDYIDFTLTEPAYVGYHSMRRPNPRTQERMVLTQVGNTGIIDQNDGTIYLKGDYAFREDGLLGKKMSDIPFPAGNYRLYSPQGYQTILSEIYVEPFNGFELPENQVEVKILDANDSFITSSAPVSRYGVIALVDGITTIQDGFNSWTYGLVNYPDIRFSISEPARLAAYGFDRTDGKPVGFEVFPVGGTDVFDVDGNLVSKDGLLVILDGDGYADTGHILPAGEYEFRTPRSVSGDYISVPTISEIAAFKDKRDITGTTQLGNVNVKILDYSVGGVLTKTSPRYGDMRFWVNGETLGEDPLLVGEMVTNGNFIEFEIEDESTISFYVIDKTQNSEPLRVALKSSDLSINTEFLGNGDGWRTTTTTVPAGVYRIGKYDNSSWNDFSVTEIRAVR